MKKYLSGITIFAMFLLCLLLPGCGRQECDFCGQKKWCRIFDVMGTERRICRDCLNDPGVAVSGNVARSYAELYENGTLEYPKDSPLRPTDENDAAADENASPTPDLEMIMNGYDPEADIRQRLLAEQAERAAAAAAANTSVPGTDTTAAGTELPAQTPQADPLPLSGNTQELIASINMSLAGDGMTLTPAGGSDPSYMLTRDGVDLGIRVKPSADPSSLHLSVEQYPGASSSDYAKAVIRSILPYLGSDDYDGLGHEVYNNTIQSGTYNFRNIIFRTITHTADEIEKGKPESEFIIDP